ncbi:hypothetical protein F2Q70_00043992 [Brassica cretica]|uniref:Uncharacterized protein n=1 Tax=Brassica cretica TaxID=69181 RepID=A0A8S9KIW1_BRACR|nr:hypothetical protein F2Q70_00043992 [Brassica cretica]
MGCVLGTVGFEYGCRGEWRSREVTTVTNSDRKRMERIRGRVEMRREKDRQSIANVLEARGNQVEDVLGVVIAPNVLDVVIHKHLHNVNLLIDLRLEDMKGDEKKKS